MYTWYLYTCILDSGIFPHIYYNHKINFDKAVASHLQHGRCKIGYAVS